MKAILLLLLLGFSIGEEAFARMGVCGNRQLPSGRIRKLRNLRLECGSSVSHFIRTPQPFDVTAWINAELRKERDEMQAIGRKKPPIEWKGTILYQTIEVWDWTDWVYGQDPSCGYDTVTHTRTNSEGEIETYTTEEMRSCWHDEDRSEAVPCSTEKMSYESEFARPGLHVWNPAIAEYYDILPNKYDLLPGEVEDVQIYSNRSQSRTITPYVDIGDAWNEYQYSLHLAGHGSSTQCRFNQPLHLKAQIHTVKRLQKRGPNPFRKPLDKFDREIESVQWLVGVDSKGEEVRVQPTAIRLTDSSDEMMRALARQSRSHDVEIEKARSETGTNTNVSAKDSKNLRKDKGFYKDTWVRVRLFKTLDYERDVRSAPYLYQSATEANDEGQYTLPVGESADDKNIYRLTGPFGDGLWRFLKAGLAPNEKYTFYVSMYNKGVPFYAQDCSLHPQHWNCRLGFKDENYWYSKELPIEFTTPKGKEFDNRGAVQKMSNKMGERSWFSIRRWFGY